MGKKNPLKRIEKAGRTAGSQFSAEAKRTGANLEQIGASAYAGATDPGAWMGYIIDPTGATSHYLGARKAKETYDALDEAEQQEMKAKAEAEMAAAEEARLMEEQKTAQEEQSRMVSEREAEATLEARRRARRLGTGRKGLLYEGATGVSDKLGG